MNGWAKLTGALTAVAGIVFIIAVIVAMFDGCDIENYRLELFANNDYFIYFTVVAGLVGAAGGLVAIRGGIGKGCSAVSVPGIVLVPLSLLLALVPYFSEVSSLTWEKLEVLLALLFIIFAAAEVVGNIKLGKYGLAVAAVILAFCVDAAYVLDLYSGMIAYIVGLLLIVLAGVSFASAAKVITKAEETAVAEEEKPEEAEECVCVPAAKPVAANPYVEPAPKEDAEPAKPVAKPVPAAEKPVAVSVAEPVKEESELDRLLAQGWKVAVDTVGEDKANDMGDYELMEVLSTADPELYQKLSVLTGIVVAVREAPAEEKPVAEPVKEESELDRLLAQGWKVAVDAVGEDRANEMSDYEIMAVISIADPELYQKLSVLTGIVVSTGDDEADVEMADEEEEEEEDYDLGLEEDTPSALVRRACWNKGLRCRKRYGPYHIPVAFVRSKVAVYIEAGEPDTRHDGTLMGKSWIVLHFRESDITDGEEQAQIVYEAVKANIRALKKPKARKSSKKKR